MSSQLKEDKVNSCIGVARLMAKAEASVNEAHNISLSLACKAKEPEAERSASTKRDKEAVREERSWSTRLLVNCKLLNGMYMYAVSPSLFSLTHSNVTTKLISRLN